MFIRKVASFVKRIWFGRRFDVPSYEPNNCVAQKTILNMLIVFKFFVLLTGHYSIFRTMNMLVLFVIITSYKRASEGIALSYIFS